MAKSKLNLSTENIVNALVYAVIGILLIVLQGGSLNILMTIVAVLLVVLGIVDIVKGKNLTKGLIEIGAGIAIGVLGWLIADIVLLVLGIVLVVKGVMELTKVYKSGFSAMLPSIVTIIIGVLLIIAKWAILDTICLIAGIVFVINAVLILFGKPIIKKKTKK